jgi:hypothetical protein
MTPDPLASHDFLSLLPLSRGELVRELLSTSSDIANMSMRIGFLRSEEIRDPKSYAKQERYELESVRQAYEEKRWLLIRLVEDPTLQADATTPNVQRPV